jgi:hypothetical protein
MEEKTIVLKKNGHWYILNSCAGDEREILHALLEYSEQQEYDIERSDVVELIHQLGYELEVHNNLNVA